MRRFAVFRGGCTREAAEQVAGATLQTLAGLVAKSMLRHDQRTGRYDIQELLRQYAQEQLVCSGEQAIAQHTHGQYYAAFMAQRTPDIKGQGQLAGLDEIEADWNNVRAAWAWALAHKNWEAVGRMMEALHLFCDMHTRFADGEMLFQAAVDALEPDEGEPPHPLRGELLVRAAEVVSLPESPAVVDPVTALLDRAEQEARMGEESLYLWVRGRVANLNGESLDALRLQEASLAGFRAGTATTWPSRWDCCHDRIWQNHPEINRTSVTVTGSASHRATIGSKRLREDSHMAEMHHLPRQATSFIGRQSEIATLLALLANPACQLTTLVGPGGIGKTRLALEVAQRVLDRFPDGVWFVPH